jgi:hypothetical protein
MALNVAALSCLVGTILLVVRLLFVGRRPKGYPPGPPTVPIFGNLTQVRRKRDFLALCYCSRRCDQLPQRDLHLQYQKWAQEYGPVYSVMLGTRAVIVLSSDQAVKEVLDNNSAVTSSRPERWLGYEILTGRQNTLFMVCILDLAALA